MHRVLRLLVLVLAALTGCRDPIEAPASLADLPVTREAAALFQTDSLAYTLAATPNGYTPASVSSSRIGRAAQHSSSTATA